MSQLPINIPPRVTVGKPITAAWANGIRESIDRLARRKPEIFSGAGTITPIPFKVSLLASGAPLTYEVTVGWGYVIERIPGADDAVTLHPPANQYYEVGDPEYEAGNPDKLRKFGITEGQAVYVKVNVTADGTIGQPEGEDPEDAVIIVVGDDEETSSHYYPKVDDETSDGAEGYYYYKLAVLDAPVAPSTTPKLAKWLTGSHIDHWQDLPKIKSTFLPSTNVGCVIKDWNPSEIAYRLRSINAHLGKNNITTNGDFIEVRGTKKDAAVIVRYGDASPSVEPFMEWSDGYMSTGTTIVGDEDPLPDPAELTLFIPAVQERPGPADPQVRVSQVGVVGSIFQVEGNGVDGFLTYTIDGGSAVNFAEVEDGLIKEILETVPIPAEVDALPSGSAGDMLYHNGTGWVVLAAPAAPVGEVANYLNHTGTAPVWEQRDLIEVSVCIDGSPTTIVVMDFSAL